MRGGESPARATAKFFHPAAAQLEARGKGQLVRGKLDSYRLSIRAPSTFFVGIEMVGIRIKFDKAVNSITRASDVTDAGEATFPRTRTLATKKQAHARVYGRSLRRTRFSTEEKRTAKKLP